MTINRTLCHSLLLTLAVIGCEQSHAVTEKAVPPVKVEVATPTEQEVTDYQDFTGRVEAVESVEIRARVSGYLTKIAFDPSLATGAEVKVGDLLFQIDERPYKLTLDSAQAQLAHAEASLKTSAADLDRTEGLFKKQISTQADLDHAMGTKMQAEASIMSGKASVAQAELDLEFTRITAPINGHVSRSLPSIGDLITPASGKLTSIVSVDPMYVYFDMDEPTVLAVQKLFRAGTLKTAAETKLSVTMGLATDDAYPFQGQLDFAENQVDANTGTLRVRGVFANPKPEKGPRQLLPGLFARVRLPIGEAHKAILIPERAIGRDQGNPFVYVVNADNDVVYRKIKLGALHDGRRVVREGLASNEMIVVNGVQRIRPGSKVDPKPASQPATGSP